jgi:hypothetical protein
LALSLANAGCGDDDDGASVDAATPDAVASIDGSTVDGGVNSPFDLLTCNTADAAPPADAATDAAPSDAGTDAAPPATDAGPGADAGPPPGIDDPCCNPDGDCDIGLECIEGPTMAEHRCRPTCSLSDRICAFGGVCANFGGQGVCIPASSIGDPCSPELCEADAICVGSTADDAICEQRCEQQSDCTMGGTCTALTGTDAMACL